MTSYDVVIAGGGPTGMMLAAELALAKVGVAIVEKRTTSDVPGRRAGGLTARTIEVLDQRGVAERFLAKGRAMQIGAFASAPLSIADLPTRHPYGLALRQQIFEHVLAAWIAELGVVVHRGAEVTGFTQDEDGVDVALDRGTIRARWLVGCDGGRSVVRKTAGIDFAGWDASVSYLLAEASMQQTPPWGIRRGEKGTNGIGPIDDGRAGIVLIEDAIGVGEPTIEQLRVALVRVYGTDFGVHDVTWLSRFTDAARQASAYRAGRVLLAGDAAHVHSPVGGQGLNLGVQDAVNLGWKLARVVRGTSREALLDSYTRERHPIAARILRTTLAQTALARGDARTDAARETFAELLAMEEPRRRFAATMSGLDVHYDLGEGHALLGRRMPDLALDGGARVFTLLHDAQPFLLSFDGTSSARVRVVPARYDGAWELPVIGVVPAPGAVLVRPDGHVAWVGLGSDAGLSDAIDRMLVPAPDV